ncbi:glutathione S-transferase N-terminal domain-containing protein [Leptospira idonii]|uniref:Glutaredoxin n=1 Tax=Leptospira idonii TaxID=1193500 RepID=A0A4R9LZN8_9LEPT|nr:glutathione S-transferase N-terminal domain-containing protein [Leptospira idonii]TGN18399.1 glutaredoxin [Leptospira idonii]
MFQLYQYASCPYCQRVISYLSRTSLVPGKDYELVEASHGTPGREEVVRLGGISQVPFLVDKETKLYESMDIIEYLKRKYS